MTHRHLRAQNLLLLVASYVFYGCWDWRFLGLIALSTLVDFFVGIRIEEADDRQRKKRWLWVSLAVNLGILDYFKYANFFIQTGGGPNRAIVRSKQIAPAFHAVKIVARYRLF